MITSRNLLYTLFAKFYVTQDTRVPRLRGNYVDFIMAPPLACSCVMDSSQDSVPDMSSYIEPTSRQLSTHLKTHPSRKFLSSSTRYSRSLLCSSGRVEAMRIVCKWTGGDQTRRSLILKRKKYWRRTVNNLFYQRETHQRTLHYFFLNIWYVTMISMMFKSLRVIEGNIQIHIPIQTLWFILFIIYSRVLDIKVFYSDIGLHYILIATEYPLLAK